MRGKDADAQNVIQRVYPDMTQRTWQGIVKVQRSVTTTHDKEQCLVYNKSRSIMMQIDMTPEVRKLFEPDEFKFFAHAWVGIKDDLHFVDRADWQAW